MKKFKKIEFRCPKCGSKFWGHGMCNGCRKFKWDREDDWKYFRKVTVTTFDSKAEYEKHAKKHLPFCGPNWL